MRHIVIDFPLKLISHIPGDLFPVLGTPLQVRAFPTKIVVEDVVKKRVVEFDIPLKGPVKDFTVELDLDKNLLKIYGHYSEGYALFFIEKKDDHICFYQKKGPLTFFSYQISCEIAHNHEVQSQLYLGIDKKPEIEKIRSRLDLKEILPYLYRVSSYYKEHKSSSHPLFKEWDKLVDKKELENSLSKIYLALFSRGFCPRVVDDECQGITVPFDGNSLEIGSALYSCIRNLFISYKKGTLFLLPTLLPTLNIGRMTQESFDTFTVSFLWKGGEVKRCILQVKEKIDLALDAPHSKKFRYRGKTFSIGETISLEKGLHFFDRFTK